MPRLKTTVSIDRETLVAACDLLGLSSTSEVVDIALDRFVRSERLLRDIRGYLATPNAADEVELGDLAVAFDLGDDDVDYDSVYASR